MPAYRVPVLIRGIVTVKYPDGKAVGDYIGGLPRDAEQEVLAHPAPFVCGAPLEQFSIELADPAERAVPNDPGQDPTVPKRLLSALKRSNDSR